jgi:O-succinylbenzoic acid--CoA ligase
MQSLVNQIACNNPDKIFSINPLCTYGELEWKIRFVSQQLIQQHLTNQTLIVLARNTIEHVILALACIRSKVIYAPVNNSISCSQLNELVSKYKFNNIYADNTNYSIPPKIKQVIINFNPVLNLIINKSEKVEIDDNIIANLIFTSGSTGTPKAVAHCLKAHIASALGSQTNIPISNNDRYLLTLPIFHIGGFAIVIKTLIGKGCIVFPSANKDLANDIINYKITHLSLVPTQLFRLFSQQFSFKNTIVKYILIGGASIPKDLLTECLKQGVSPYISYGLSEMASQVCTKRIDETNINELDTGTVLPFRNVKISEHGEILVKGETLFLGYYDGQKLNLPTDEEGYFNTRDLGELSTVHGSLCLKVQGRVDNQFISGGENIQPEEIEKILLSNKLIQKCIIVGVPDKEWGNMVIALIETVLSKKQLYEFCKNNLLRHQVPKKFYPINSLNIDFNFKIKRKEILKQILNLKDSIDEIS